jgi:hypothetical protein
MTTTSNENNPTPPFDCCLFGIPTRLPIPKPGETCPHTHVKRTTFYRLIESDRFIKLTLLGVKAPAEVYGPSVCDAQFGCRCAQRDALMALRRKNDPNK